MVYLSLLSLLLSQSQALKQQQLLSAGSRTTFKKRKTLINHREVNIISIHFQTFTDLLSITSPNARLPERNATIAIPAVSNKICPNVPLTQYLKNRISKHSNDVKNTVWAIGAFDNAVLNEEIFTDAKNN